MSELTKAEDEDVLPGAAGVQKAQPTSTPPVGKPQVVELLEVLRNDKWRDAVLETFL